MFERCLIFLAQRLAIELDLALLVMVFGCFLLVDLAQHPKPKKSYSFLLERDGPLLR
jgi:hypothetical protein